MDNGLLDDELDDIIEKPCSKVKSAEEIKSHTIDEDINNFKKAIILLRSNYEAQIICGIKMLPDLLKEEKQACILRVFPEFKDICFNEDYNRSQEFYYNLNECLIQILSTQLLSSKEFAFHFIDLITNKIYLYCDKPADYENSIIFQLWVELMVGVIENLTDNLVKSTIFDLLPRTKLPIVSRRAREYISLILAKCAPKMSPQTVQAQLYPTLQDLCNDAQYEVRAIACQSLAPVCKVLGGDITMNLVVPEMSKYLCDESVLVKTSCFQSLIEILELFDEQDDAKVYLLRKIQSFIDYGLTLKDEHYLITISKNLGTIVNCLKDVMNTQVKSSFIHIFYSICKDENLYTRRSSNESNFIWCKCKINLANSFPSILQITNSINFENKLSHCLTSLVKDRNENVREAIVLKFIEIAQKLGSSQYFLIINDYCTSLTDESPQVLSSAVKQLEKFLNLFIKKTETNGILNESQQMPGHQLVAKRLIKLEDTVSQSYKYSLHVEILQAFAILPWVLCTEFLVEEILPILDKRTNSRALPVRLAAIRSLLIILRKIPRFQVRNMYFTKLNEFSFHSNCYKRTVFIEISKLVIELYSKNFFKSNFYHSIIRMAHDPVVNVRISFIKILTELKKLCNMRHDKDKLENLEVIARSLLNDRDKDVSELAFRAITQMDFIRTHVNNDAEDQFNKMKEQEELLLIDLEPKKAKTSTNLQNSRDPKKPEQSLTAHNKDKEPKSRNLNQIRITQSTLTKSQQLEHQFGSRSFPNNSLYASDTYTAIKEKKSNHIVPLSLSAERGNKTKSYEVRRNSIDTYSQPTTSTIKSTPLISAKKK